ncbi:MAG: alpha/beta hydrolase [Gemmatimonadetes bacterium]|nr:alpha/beta hydrolase [Gemmatimonadota bacterium]
MLGITRRGFGGSSRPEGGYDSQTRAADIVAVLDSLRIPRAVLVGHSLAGDELTRIAATYPQRVRALVYLDAYEYGDEFRRMQEEMPEVPQDAPPAPMTAADSASLQSFIAYRERLLGVTYPIGEVLIHARFAPDGRFTGMLPRKEREVRAGLAPADLSRVAAPALAIYVPIESVEQFFERYSSFDAQNQAAARHAFAIWSGWNSNARTRFRTLAQRPTVVLLRGAHHFVFLTHPELVEREIRAFLSRNPG